MTAIRESEYFSRQRSGAFNFLMTLLKAQILCASVRAADRFLRRICFKKPSSIFCHKKRRRHFFQFFATRSGEDNGDTVWRTNGAELRRKVPLGHSRAGLDKLYTRKHTLHHHPTPLAVGPANLFFQPAGLEANNSLMLLAKNVECYIFLASSCGKHNGFKPSGEQMGGSICFANSYNISTPIAPIQ